MYATLENLTNVHGRSAKNGRVAFRGYNQFPHKMWHYQLTNFYAKMSKFVKKTTI
jgi:hypothetical protein